MPVRPRRMTHGVDRLEAVREGISGPCQDRRIGLGIRFRRRAHDDQGQPAMKSARSQSHFTLAFPFKSPADALALPPKLTSLMPEMARAQDTIGTVHYSRFTVLS